MNLLTQIDQNVKPANNERQGDKDTFNPNPAKGSNNTYAAVIRFVYWWEDPLNNSWYKKHSAILTNPISKEKLYVDCPSTTGAPSILWSLDMMIGKRVKAKTDQDLTTRLKENFNRYYNYYSPIYVIKDPHVPENNNRIMIYPHGFTIYEMIDKLRNPVQIEGMQAGKKIEPFSFVAGKDFMVVVKKGTKYGKDYSSSKFDDNVSAFRYLDKTTQQWVYINPAAAPAEMEAQNNVLMEYLKANTPDLKKYFFRPWSDGTCKSVASYLKAIIPYKNFMNELLEYTNDDRMKQFMYEALTVNPADFQQAPAAPVQASHNPMALESQQAQQAPAYVPPVYQQPAPVQQASAYVPPVYQQPAPVQQPPVYQPPVQQAPAYVAPNANAAPIDVMPPKFAAPQAPTESVQPQGGKSFKSLIDQL